MKCFRCSESMATGATLFRVNEKGVPAIWACRAHCTSVDDQVDAITGVIEEAERMRLGDAYLKSIGLGG